MKLIPQKTICLALLLLLPAWAAAEVIHLKDGTTIKVSKTWEDGGWVRFYLKDYDGIVITYARDIIDRIESDDGRVLKTYTTPDPSNAKAAAKPPAEADKPSPAKAAAAKPPKSKSAAAAVPAGEKPATPDLAPAPTPESAAAAPTSPLPAQAPSTATAAKPQPSPAPAGKPQPSKSAVAAPPAANPPPVAPPVKDEFSAYEGMLFYNPRRDFKYWSGPNTRHHTLKEAVAALAEKFDRTPEWVQQHLGETNDLAQIYRNLSRTAVKKESPPAADTLAANGLLFYDPRRPFKFHLSAKLKFRTLDEAAAALGRQYDRSPEWVKEHLGETNDVGEIHQNLARAKASETK